MKASELRKIQEEEEDNLLQQRKRQQRDETNSPTSNEALHSKEQTATASPEQPLTKKQRSNDPVVLEKKELSVKEITQRLRSLGMPIKLFAESHDDRINRLQAALDQQTSQNATQTEMDEYRLGRGHQIRNTFLEKDKKQQQSEGAVAQKEKSKPKKDSTDKQKADHEEEEDTSNDPHKRIYKYFKGLLREWEDDLALRPESTKRTAAGKNEVKTLKQCRDYVRPLFKLCKSRTLEESMLAHIIKIVDYCQQNEFVKAHDAYIDVAIGRAAWPIGVTMVGIHARSGRAKIESANVAHVMNSELQRKFLTSVKRLMTYAQRKAADVNPSKKVMN